jgi:CheY-like chemotaxis protein
LDISKIESGKIELEKIPFDLHEIFKTCQMMMTPKATEKGLVLYFYVEPSVGKIPLGDPTRLLQVLINLLSNAIKFTSTGIIKLDAAIKSMSESSVTISFRVKDSGIGMTEEQIKRIFDPFMQGESGTTRKYGGTGLGLAITKSIVEIMGGKLIVGSTPKVGSYFSFELTFDIIDASEEILAEMKKTLIVMKKPIFTGEVLLCEDNYINQQVICEHLARVGLKTVVAENGKIGVDMVSSRIERGEKPFDLIFMDIHMPVMDGLEAARKIMEFNIGVPVVAITANMMTHDRELYRTCGMSGYVGKPFTSQELWGCLMQYLEPVSLHDEEPSIYEQADDELRQKFINNFVESNREKFKEITNAINGGDIELAHRLVHTLKGNAAQLGITLLQSVAQEVEELLKDGENLVSPEQLTALETELNTALTELEPLVCEHSGDGAETAAEPLDGKAARELIEKLEPLLKNGNPESLEYIDTLRRIPGSGELIRQMEGFKFKPAMKIFHEWKKGALSDG